MFFIEFLLYVATIFLVFLTYKKNNSGLFSAVSLYLILFSLMYILRHGLLITGLDTPMPDGLFISNANEERLVSLFSVFLWSLGFLVAQYIPVSTSFSSKLFPKPPLNYLRVNLKIINVILAALTVVIVITLVRTYGFSVGDISYAVRLDSFFSGYSFLLSVNVFGAYFLAVTAFLKFQEGFVKGYILYSVLSLLCISPSILLADRDNLVFFIMFYFLGVCIFVSRKFIFALAPAGLASIWLIVSLQSSRLESWGHIKEFTSIFRKISSGLNHQFYDSFLLLIQEGFQMRWGLDFLLGLIGVIPRAIWKGKPEMVDPGIWFSNQFIEDAAYGWPVSVVGEWWLNFWFPGALLGGYLTGCLYWVVHNKYLDFMTNPFSWLAVFIIATRVLPIGFSATSPMYYVLSLGPVFILFYFITRKLKL